MNKKIEQAPSEIFDWLKMYAFSELSTKNQAEVLKYLSKEEYIEMHETFLGIKAVSDFNKSSLAINRENNVMSHFDRHQANRRKTTSTSLFVWRAAAMLLLLLSGGLFYNLINIKSVIMNREVASVDTVYVTKEVKSNQETLHDTVYISNVVITKTYSPASINDSGAIGISADGSEAVIDIPVMGLKDLNDRANSIKGNSMKEDTLLKKYGYVTI